MAKQPLKTTKIRTGKDTRFKPGNPGGPGRPRKGETAADFAAQAIDPETVWTALAKLIRHGSITAIGMYLDRFHGKSWSEAELLELRAIQEAEQRIAAARKGDHHGDIAASEGGEVDGTGGTSGTVA